MRNTVLKLKLATRLHSSCYIKEANESVTRVDSTDPSITDPDPDHPKGMHPYTCIMLLLYGNMNMSL